MTVQRKAIGLVGWLALSFAAAGLGALATTDAGDFYRSLSRPAWAPPPSVFGPVWTLLYFLMGIAAWQVWKAKGWSNARGALTLFIAQLAANALWSWLFFTWRIGAAAFIEILVLWVLIAGTVAAFWRISRLAGVLLLPYLAWVTFAGALTLAVWQRNPQLLGLAHLP